MKLVGVDENVEKNYDENDEALEGDAFEGRCARRVRGVMRTTGDSINKHSVRSTSTYYMPHIAR